MCNPLGTVLTRATTAFSHPVSRCVGTCERLCTLWLVAVLSWRACALEGQNRLLCVDGGAQEASVENFKA